MGFSRQEHWHWLPFPSPGDLADPGIELASPAWQADSFPLSHQGSPNQLDFNKFLRIISIPKKEKKISLVQEASPLCNHSGQYLGKTVIYCWKDKRKYSLKATPGIMKNPDSLQFTFLSNKPHVTEILNIAIVSWVCPVTSSSPYRKRQFLAFSNCCLCVGLT